MNKSKIIRIIVWAFVLFCIVKGSINLLSQMDHFPNDYDVKSESTSEIPLMKRIFTKSPFKVLITNYEDVTDNDTRTVKLSLTYENISNKKQPTLLHNVTLKDSKGNKFLEDKNVSNSSLTLDPGIIESGEVVYKIPEDAVVESIYVNNELTWEIIK